MNVKDGDIRGVYKRSNLVYGIGINDANYVISRNKKYINSDGVLKYKNEWKCPFYQKWASMLQRSTKKWQIKYKSYEGVQICLDWLYFSNFKAWMETQDWEGKNLDKDLLVPGNKIYGPDTCLFISQDINKFLLESKKPEGSKNKDLPVGVNPLGNGYYSTKISNPFTKTTEQLGKYDTPKKAFEAWLKRKLELARIYATIIIDEKVSKALINYYENYGENHE